MQSLHESKSQTLHNHAVDPIGFTNFLNFVIAHPVSLTHRRSQHQRLFLLD